MDSEIIARHITTLEISLSVKLLLKRNQSPTLYFNVKLTTKFIPQHTWFVTTCLTVFIYVSIILTFVSQFK